MIVNLLSALIGGLLGAIIGAIFVLYVAHRTRKQQYYLELINSISEHNWKLLEHNLDPGLSITDVELKVRVVCYQHLNIFLLAWLHKKIIEKDGSLSGWKNWAAAILSGTKIKENENFSYAYHDILLHGDLYPKSFMSWLEKDMGLSATVFNAREMRMQ